MSGKIIQLDEARQRRADRDRVKEAYEAWVERIVAARPGLIPRLLSNIASALGCEKPGYTDGHPWVPMALVRYAATPLFRYDPVLQPPAILAGFSQGEVEAWYVERASTFEIEFRRLRASKDRTVLRSKLTLSPWFDPKPGDTFLAVRTGPAHKPEWLVASRVDREVGESLLAVLEFGTWSSSTAYAEDLFVLTSGEGTQLAGLTGRKFIPESALYPKYGGFWEPEFEEQVASVIETLATRTHFWEFPHDIELEGPIASLLIFDEPICEDGRSGIELVRDWATEGWGSEHVTFDDAQMEPILDAFGLGTDSVGDGDCDADKSELESKYRLLARWRRAFPWIQLGLLDHFSVRDGMREEFRLLKLGISLAPAGIFDRPLYSLPIGNGAQKKLAEGMPGARLDDPELSVIELERVRGFGKKSLRQLLDVLTDLLMSSRLDP